MKKVAVVFACVAAVGGCAAPPALQVIALLADVVSYAFSEKSVSDHGLSIAAHRDCAIWRVVTEGSVCREEAPVIQVAGVAGYSQSDVAVDSEESHPEALPPAVEVETLAAIPTAAGSTEMAEPAHADRADAEAIRLTSAPSVAEAADAKPLVRVARRVRSYVVIGSFNKEKDAEKLARRHAALAPRVVSATVEGSKRFRVVVGPFVDGDRDKVRRRVAAAGVTQSWVMSARG